MNHVMKEQRREDAKARQAARADRSPTTQTSLLDERLGQGVGATRERARLRKASKGKGKS